MKQHIRSGPQRLLIAFLVSALCGVPSIATAQTYRTSSRIAKVRPRIANPYLSTALLRVRNKTLRTSSTTRSVLTLSRPIAILPRTTPTRDNRVAAARMTIELNGSYSALVNGAVTIRRANAVIAQGSVSRAITVPGGGPVNIVVTATSLVDEPSINLTGVALPANGGALTIPTSIETGLVRAQATLDGRSVSGVVRFYRIDATTGIASNQSCGSIGANGGAQEISTGRYLAVLNTGGDTLSQEFNIGAGASRLVRLTG